MDNPYCSCKPTRVRSLQGMFVDVELALTTIGTSLIINPNTLTPGSKYAFRLEHTFAGATGFARLEFIVNTKPSAGTFVVTPLSGESTAVRP